MSGFFLAELAFGNADFKLTYIITGETERRGEEVFADTLSRHQFVRELLFILQGEGYLFAHVAELYITEQGDQNVKIQTGKRFEWLSLNKGNLEEWLILKSGIDPQKFQRIPVDYTAVKRIFDAVLKVSENQGYPFASIHLDSIRLTGQQIGAAIAYNAGPRITFDTLRVTGNSLTRPIFFARLMDLLPGEPFSQAKVDRSFGLLKNIPYLQLVGEPKLSFQNEEATVYFPINDRRINSLDGIIGILPNEVEGNKLLVTGQFDIALYNVSGKGRNYLASWQRLSQYSQNLRLTAVEPMVLGSGLDVKASFFLLKEDTTFLNRDFKLDVGYRVSPSTYLSFFTRRQTGDLLSTSQLAEVEVLPDVADFRFTNYGMSLEFNTVDDVFFPKRGILSSFTFGLGNKRIVQNTGLAPRLYEDIDRETFQYYLQGGITYHHLWRPQLGTMVNLQAGQTANPNLLLNDLFRLGGLKSIRGFNENYFFASQYAYLTVEPRFYFDTSSYFLIFVDAAGINNQVTELGRDFPFSFGGGFSMQTKGGIFNFVYALGSSETQPLGFNYSRIHFGYTGRF
ncbi:BamA/TamA family outer membrane protein [Lunatibacter salilacus]|uniref:BamA/TamA family outer membrane protein n=1 Tax=Lunatibacter salilacus TaxID=2483804 RepID=UPI00131D4A4F|nr:BamA/TamA family outer membrane protein [Lunatibacter salilacus]